MFLLVLGTERGLDRHDWLVCFDIFPESHIVVSFLNSPVQEIGSMVLIEVAVNMNLVIIQVTVWSRLRVDRVFKLSRSGLILHFVVRRIGDSDVRSFLSTLGWVSLTLFLSL